MLSKSQEESVRSNNGRFHPVDYLLGCLLKDSCSFRPSGARRSETDPSKAWHVREIFLFVNHAIPPLDKLFKRSGKMDCDDLLRNIRCNHQEWVQHGIQQVNDFVSELGRSIEQQNVMIVFWCNGSSKSSHRFTLQGEEDQFQ
jgi:hypothetical protein